MFMDEHGRLSYQKQQIRAFQILSCIWDRASWSWHPHCKCAAASFWSISACEFSWYIISVDVVNSVWNIPLRAPLLILIAVCSQSGQNTVFKWHPWPLQTNALDTRSAFASPGRACILNMYYFGVTNAWPARKNYFTVYSIMICLK